jgi:signal transduction histidine kinase
MNITDNGIGFDYTSKKENNNSLGLENISKRAKIINYHAEIVSETNNGTSITIKENLN